MTKQIAITVTKSGGVYFAHSIIEYSTTICARDWRGFCQQEMPGVMEIEINEDTKRDSSSRSDSTGNR